MSNKNCKARVEYAKKKYKDQSQKLWNKDQPLPKQRKGRIMKKGTVPDASKQAHQSSTGSGMAWACMSATHEQN